MPGTREPQIGTQLDDGKWRVNSRLNDSHQSDGQKFGLFFGSSGSFDSNWQIEIVTFVGNGWWCCFLCFFRFSAIELSPKHYLSVITEIDHWLLVLFLPVLLALSQIDPTIGMAIEKSTVYYFVSTKIVESTMHIEPCFRNKKGFVSASYLYVCFQRTWNHATMLCFMMMFVTNLCRTIWRNSKSYRNQY